MRQVCSALLILMLMLISDTSAYASRYDDCSRSENSDRQIRGCSEILKRGKREILRNRSYAYYNRGLAYYNKRQYDRAIADYDQSIKLNPRYAIAYNNRGLAYDNTRQYDRAIADYDQSIRLNPRYAYAYYNRGIAHRHKRQYDRAIADYDQSIKLAPRFAKAYYSRGIAYRHKRQYDRAIADYGQAIKLTPRFAKAYYSRGYAYYNIGDFKAAAADQLRSLELNDSVYALLFRYLARRRSGEAASKELQANAGRLKDKKWPYAIIELYLGQRSPQAMIDAADSSDEKCEAQFHISQWNILQARQSAAVTALKTAVDICPKTLIEYAAALAELKRRKLSLVLEDHQSLQPQGDPPG